MGWPLGLVAGVLVSVGCEYGYYLAVERPVLRAARGRAKLIWSTQK